MAGGSEHSKTTRQGAISTPLIIVSFKPWIIEKPSRTLAASTEALAESKKWRGDTACDETKKQKPPRQPLTLDTQRATGGFDIGARLLEIGRV
jgi:hypothetical protein